jgi:glutamyl-tRNA synthetase
MRPVEFATMCREELRTIHLEIGENAAAIFALMQERIKIRTDIIPAMTFFCTDDYEYDGKAVEKKLLKTEIFQTLEKIAGILQGLEQFDAETVNKALHDFVEQGGLKFGDVMPPLRIAVSGQQSGPDLAPVLAILGKETAIARIHKTLMKFGS